MVKIKNLCFSYKGTPPYILDNINLEIKEGSYVSIIGENGSAKSTLIKLIIGLLNPCSGEIGLSTNFIGYVPQRFEGFNSQFPITVLELLNCHRRVIGIKNADEIKRCMEITSIYELKNNLIGNLSGGQQQRVFIARALLGNPRLLILDEPSTGIDIKSQNEIYGIIKSLSKEAGVTVISVEHNMEAAIKNSTHIYSLYNGRGTLYTIEEFLTKSGEVYFDVSI